MKFKSTSLIIHSHSLSCSSLCWNAILKRHCGLLIPGLSGISSPGFCSFFLLLWVSLDNIPGKPASHYWPRSGGQPFISLNIRTTVRITGFSLGTFSKPWGLSPSLCPGSWDSAVFPLGFPGVTQWGVCPQEGMCWHFENSWGGFIELNGWWLIPLDLQ